MNFSVAYSLYRVLLLSAAVVSGSTILLPAEHSIAQPVPQLCSPPNQGSLVLIHDTRKRPEIDRRLPPGATISDCRWFAFKSQGRSATPLSIRVGGFIEDKNANAWAARIRQEVFKDPKSRLVEVVKLAE